VSDSLSVVTIVKNDRDGFRRTRASVAEQTHPRIEYVVVDGGSSDGTPGAIRECADARRSCRCR